MWLGSRRVLFCGVTPTNGGLCREETFSSTTLNITRWDPTTMLGQDHWWVSGQSLLPLIEGYTKLLKGTLIWIRVGHIGPSCPNAC